MCSDVPDEPLNDTVRVSLCRPVYVCFIIILVNGLWDVIINYSLIGTLLVVIGMDMSFCAHIHMIC